MTQFLTRLDGFIVIVVVIVVIAARLCVGHTTKKK